MPSTSSRTSSTRRYVSPPSPFSPKATGERERERRKEDKITNNLQVLRPVSRLGGISYGRLTQAVEIPRPSFEKDLGGREGLAKLQGLKN